MSAVALLLREKGFAISGSDEGFYPPISDFLTQHNIPCATPYHPDNIPPYVDRIVIGKNAKLVPETNDEVAAAFKRESKNKTVIVSFPEILGELTADTHNIVIAGSYGKSTCTALLAHILVTAGKDPSYFIGAIPKAIHGGTTTTAHSGSGNIFVLEGDEYPSSNWDNRSKFLHYNAKDILLTSATHDHINIYPTLEEYHAPFQKLIEAIPPDGLLIASVELYAQELFTQYNGKKFSYGLSKDADYSAENISYGERTTFNLLKQGKKVVAMETSLLGAHNIENIVGCAALALERKLVTIQELKSGVASFLGIVRRLDRKSEKTRIPIYEGFGSSREKAQSAIEAMHNHFPNRQLIIIFEPHTFTWRNKAALPHYKNIFSTSALTLIYEPATQGAHTHEQLTHTEIVDFLNQNDTHAHAIHTKEDGLLMLEKNVTEDSVILLLTSGDLGGLIDGAVEFAEKSFPL